MSTHTPGPWTARRALHSSDGGWDWGIGAEVGGRNRCIAETFDVVAHGLTAPAEANARLIAAAPDMLAALQELEEFLDNQADADDGIPNDAMRHLVEVRAAIAKAEGRS